MREPGHRVHVARLLVAITADDWKVYLQKYFEFKSD